MKIEMRDLRNGPYTLEFEELASQFELKDPHFQFDQRVKGHLQLQLVNNRVVAKGKVETRAQTSCVRCLASTTVPVRATVDAVYEKDEELLKPEVEAFGHADQQISYFDGESVNPAPEIREALMLELPTLPLCKDDCKGLCPQCGANWNEQTCSCDINRQSPTGWKDALKDIKLED